jgi:secondary thiamine-phosphate synthase enzyme
MAVFQQTIRLKTHGDCHVIDITPDVIRVVGASRLKHGIVNISGVGSTLGITTTEYEPGCISDLQRALDLIAPPVAGYAHNARWNDDNGYSHLRSSLVGTAKSFPLYDGKLAIGQWQQVVLCDFDSRPRERQVVVTIVGE